MHAGQVPKNLSCTCTYKKHTCNPKPKSGKRPPTQSCLRLPLRAPAGGRQKNTCMHADTLALNTPHQS